MHFNDGTRNQRKLCGWRGRKGDLRWRPCLRHKNVKLYTLFKAEDPENDTLTGGTWLYRKYMEVPPGGVLSRQRNLHWICFLFYFSPEINKPDLSQHSFIMSIKTEPNVRGPYHVGLPLRCYLCRVGSGVWSVVPTPLHAWSGDPRSALNNVSCLGWLYFVMPWCSCVDVLVFVVWNSCALLTVECCGLDESWGPVSQAPQDRGWCGLSIGTTRVHSTGEALWANTSCMDHTKSPLVIYLRGNPASVVMTLGTYMRSLLLDMKENVRALL